MFWYMQDLQDRMRKEAKKEMDERGVLQRDEDAAAREDDDYQVSMSMSTLVVSVSLLCDRSMYECMHTFFWTR